MSSELSLLPPFSLLSILQTGKKSSPGCPWSTFSQLSNPYRVRGGWWLLFFPVSTYNFRAGFCLAELGSHTHGSGRHEKIKVPWLTIWPGSNEVRVRRSPKETGMLGRQNTHKKEFLKKKAPNSPLVYISHLFIMSLCSSSHQEIKNLGWSCDLVWPIG